MKIELEFLEDRQKREIIITVLARKAGCREEWTVKKVMDYSEILAHGEGIEDRIAEIKGAMAGSAVYALSKK